MKLILNRNKATGSNPRQIMYKKRRRRSSRKGNIGRGKKKKRE
jgi:hypothetical protein